MGQLVITGRPEDVERYKNDRGVINNIDPATGQQVVYGGLKRFWQSLGQPVNPNFSNPEFRLLGGTIKSVRDSTGKASDEPGFNPEDKLLISGIANANVVDRVDERLDPRGIEIEHYMLNNILLADHMYFTDAAVGLVDKLETEDDGVHFEAWVGHPKKGPLTEKQKSIRTLVAQGIIKTVSVGFIPKKIKAPVYSDEGTMIEPAVIEKWELLELSVVSVPANPLATFEMRGKDVTLNETGKGSVKTLTNTTNEAKNKSKINSGKKQLEIIYEKESDLWYWFWGGVKIAQADLDSTTVQTLIFDKEKYSMEEAVEWAKEHDYKADKVDETDGFYRLRQRNPDDFDDDSFRTIDLEDGVQAVIGKLKNDISEDAMDEKTAQELLDTVKDLVTMSRDTNSKLLRSIELSETILSHHEKGGKPNDDDKDDDKDKDKDKDDDEKSIEKQVKEMSEAVKAQGETITKLGVIVEKLMEQSQAG
jgi:hypothetical protein